MRNADKNRDPERARKRARADLRCAARKLGGAEALVVLAEVSEEARALRAVAYTLTGEGARPEDWPEWWDHDDLRMSIERLRGRLEGAE